MIFDRLQQTTSKYLCCRKSYFNLKIHVIFTNRGKSASFFVGGKEDFFKGLNFFCRKYFSMGAALIDRKSSKTNKNVFACRKKFLQHYLWLFKKNLPHNVPHTNVYFRCIMRHVFAHFSHIFQRS